MNPCEQKLSNDLHTLKAECGASGKLTDHRLLALRELVDERDRLYKERDEARRTAVDAALAAAKEKTKDAFDASEKAIVKAEEAQKAYNQSHNDLARKMDDQNKATMPRAETEQRFKGLEEKLAILTGSFTAGSGAQMGVQQQKDDARASVSMLISIISALIVVGGVVVALVKSLP